MRRHVSLLQVLVVALVLGLLAGCSGARGHKNAAVQLDPAKVPAPFHTLVDIEFVKPLVFEAMLNQNPSTGAMLIDARPKQPRYDKGHIPTAVSLPDSQFDKLAPEILPTPANAIFIVSLSLIAGEAPLFDAGVISLFAGNLWVQLLLIPLSCWLLVSDIPMFALKFSRGFGVSQNKTRYLFLLLSVLLLVFFRFGGIPLIIVMYIMISLFTEGEKN